MDRRKKNGPRIYILHTALRSFTFRRHANAKDESDGLWPTVVYIGNAVEGTRRGTARSLAAARIRHIGVGKNVARLLVTMLPPYTSKCLTRCVYG